MDANMNRFQELVDAGEAAAKSSNFEQANELLSKAEALVPNSTRVLKARGAVLLAQMNHVSAIAYFDRALSIDANDPKILTGRGMCDLVQRHYASASIFFERALRLKPDYVVALHQLLECSYNLEEYDIALASIERFLNVRPDDVNIRFCLAGCLFKTGQIAKSLIELDKIEKLAPAFDGAQELRKVIEATLQGVDPQSATTAEELQGLHSYSPSEVKDSLQELSQSVSSWTVGGNSNANINNTAQNDIEISNALSAVEDSKRSKNFEAAEISLNTLINRGIANPVLRRTAECIRAELLVIRGELEKAGEIYDSVLSENPSVPRALCGKGALCAEDQDWTTAKAYFDRALAIDSNCDIAYAGLGLCSMVAGNQERAFELFELAGQKNPENQRALIGVLQTGYSLKKYNEMERMISSYLNLHPASIDMLYSLAGVLFAQGKVNEAKLEIEKILIFEPKHEHALELKGMIQEKDTEDQGDLAH